MPFYVARSESRVHWSIGYRRHRWRRVRERAGHCNATASVHARCPPCHLVGYLFVLGWRLRQARRMRRSVSSSLVWGDWTARSPVAGHCSGCSRESCCVMPTPTARTGWRTLTFGARPGRRWSVAMYSGCDAVCRGRREGCKRRAEEAGCDGRKECAEGWRAKRLPTWRQDEGGGEARDPETTVVSDKARIEFSAGGVAAKITTVCSVACCLADSPGHRRRSGRMEWRGLEAAVRCGG